MFAAMILLAATLLEEVQETLGKKAVRQQRENIYSMAFLAMFWTLLFLIISVFLGAKFVVKPASIPLLATRSVLEIVFSYIVALGVIRTDRSTLGFMRLLTIPLLLAIDISLGYHLSNIQIAGICVMFTGLAAAFYHNPHGQRGSGIAIAIAILGAVTTTLYKWDITHFNSVAGDQITVCAFNVLFFFIMSVKTGPSPLKLLVQRRTGIQSLANGLGLAIESFAFTFAPASVIIALKRSFALIWCILFGKEFFHEKKTRHKLYAGAFMVTGLMLLVSPYL
jgi:hypothetical protein